MVARARWGERGGASVPASLMWILKENSVSSLRDSGQGSRGRSPHREWCGTLALGKEGENERKW